MGDSVSVNIEDADMTNQDLGQPQPGPAQRSQRGRATFTAYSKQPPRTHKASECRRKGHGGHQAGASRLSDADRGGVDQAALVLQARHRIVESFELGALIPDTMA